MGKLTEFKSRVKERMDLLQSYMESNHQLSNMSEVVELLDECRSYWHFLSEEDKDYIHGIDYFLEEMPGQRWTVD